MRSQSHFSSEEGVQLTLVGRSIRVYRFLAASHSECFAYPTLAGYTAGIVLRVFHFSKGKELCIRNETVFAVPCTQELVVGRIIPGSTGVTGHGHRLLF